MTSEERQTLRVPAQDQRAEFGEDAGYNVTSLQTALALCDPNNFKRFRQANCLDPVAVRVRVIALDMFASPGEKPKKNPKFEVNALNKPPATSKPFHGKPEKMVPLPQQSEGWNPALIRSSTPLFQRRVSVGPCGKP